MIFAAIAMALKGMAYCVFLQEHGLKPKWADSGPTSYTKSYEQGGTWRKRVQDEKSRASARMKNYPEPHLREAFVTYLPDKFNEIAQMNSRNSRSASGTSASQQHA